MTAPAQTLSTVVAMSQNNVIGKDGGLPPWRLPKDFKRVKDLTQGHHIIMGRRTFESLGGQPLPKRTNVVITRKMNYTSEYENVVVLNSLDKALNYVKGSNDEEPFIFGGEEIYKMALPYIQKIYLTIVHDTFNGDAFFPELNPDEWSTVEEEMFSKDDRHSHNYSFLTLVRQKEPASY